MLNVWRRVTRFPASSLLAPRQRSFCVYHDETSFYLDDGNNLNLEWMEKSKANSILNKKRESWMRHQVPELPIKRYTNPLVCMSIEEDSRDGKTMHYAKARNLVWWDMNDTPLPTSANVKSLPWSIMNGLRWAGYFGPVILLAYGSNYPDLPWRYLDMRLKKYHGYCHFTYLPCKQGDIDATCNRMALDMIDCSRKISQGYYDLSNFLLISSNEHFHIALEKIEMDGNISFLAQSSTRPESPLTYFAKRMWKWDGLVRGGPPFTYQIHSRGYLDKPTMS